MQSTPATSRIAIACGGTGGHLFPGLAVAEQLRLRGGEVTILISPKEIDQKAVRSARGVKVETLPAVGLTKGSYLAFGKGFLGSYRASWRLFRQAPPEAVLAMGGFTSAPPVLAGKMFQAATFLHESNTIPGKANRWLSWVVDQAFVGFPDSQKRLHSRKVAVTGTPVRAEFHAPTGEAAASARIQQTATARKALGLAENQPVLLVTGGSQGAHGLNEMVLAALPLIAAQIPDLQLLHLTGPQDGERIQAACAGLKLRAVVMPFYSEMSVALAAADAVVSRAGASSLAEVAAQRLPALLVPFPAATDNHQFFNALAFQSSGAALLLDQQETRPETLAASAIRLLRDAAERNAMQAALARWHAPNAAGDIADHILKVIGERRQSTGVLSLKSSPPNQPRPSISA